MIRPDAARRALAREFQLGTYARMEEAARRFHEEDSSVSVSHIQGALAAGLAASLISNLAQRGNGDVIEVADNLLLTIQTAAERGDIEMADMPKSGADEEC